MFVVNVLIPIKTLLNVQYDWGEQPVFNDVIFELPFLSPKSDNQLTPLTWTATSPSR